MSAYGNLKPNTKARGRRDKVKFFDSADWAMKGQNTAEPSPSTDQKKPVAPPFTQMDNQDEGESPLAAYEQQPGGESLLVSGNSTSTGEDSPLAG